MSFLESLTPDQMAVMAVVLALLFSENKTTEELNVLGNLIVAIGSILLTIAAQQESQIKGQEENPNKQILAEIAALKQQLNQLQKGN